MARKIRARLIPQLRAAGHPRNAIARSQKMAKASVIAVFDAADELGIAWEGVEGKTDAEVYSTPFPGRYPAESVFEQPDWGYAHKGLGKAGVTLGMLHAGYADACAREGGVPMSYATFWRGYGRFVEKGAVASHITRRAGRSVEAGWGGPTMSPVDAATGEIVKVDLFVASLSHSRCDYVGPTLDMRRDTWLPCHVHMSESFGASVPRIIPDDCKTAIVRHPKEGGVVLDDACRETAARYGAAVLPARVRKPRDRPAAEGPVGNIATGIIAAQRDLRVDGAAEGRRRREARRAQRPPVPEARGLGEVGPRAGRAPPDAGPAGRTVRDLPLALRPQGRAELPRRLRPQPLLVQLAPRRRGCRPARGPDGDRDLREIRRALGHTPAEAPLREKRALDARRGHARRQGVARVGRRQDTAVGRTGRTSLRVVREPHPRVRAPRGAGPRCRPRAHQAVGEVLGATAWEGVRDRAR